MKDNKYFILPTDYYNWTDSEIYDFVVNVIEKHYHCEESKEEFIAYFNSFLQADRKVFRAIVDKLISGEIPTKYEIEHIRNRIAPKLDIYSFKLSDLEKFELSEKDKTFWGLIYDFNDPFSALMQSIYQWLISASQRVIKIDRCSLHGCNRIFEIRQGAHKKKFCSNAHKMKDYRERKKNCNNVVTE